jgi:hypothetical protein
VAGEPFPGPLPATWGLRLERALAAAGVAGVPFRVIRTDGPRAIVRVPRGQAASARRAWNSAASDAEPAALRTVRTWGTLVDARGWIAGAALRSVPRRGGPSYPDGSAHREPERRELER